MTRKKNVHRLAALLAGALLLAACQPSDPDQPPGAGVEADAEAPADPRVEYAPGDAEAPDWLNPLSAAIGDIDADMPGRFGVYVRRLGEDAGSLDLGDDHAWYLSSTIKVPVAIAVLEQVDAGRLSLDQELELRESDFVDGAGDMLGREPGELFSIATLLEKSLRDSDSTATDMLIRQIGEVDLNRRIRDWVGRGFGRITTILQVRYDAYGALHPRVVELSNMELVGLRQAGDRDARLDALADLLEVGREDLDAESLEAVFGRYYETGANSAPLEMFADMLQMLVAGELLSEESTQLLLDHMRAISTGDRRIQAGLPAGTDFAQKTGTQIARACNVGVINPDAVEEDATIVVACAEDYDDIAEAEGAFQALGRALAEAGLAP
ncbi:MAG: serine hydrolase [Luteimonas sp.]